MNIRAVNPNMPVEGFLYFAETYQKYLKNINFNLYGSKADPSAQTTIYVLFIMVRKNSGSFSAEDVRCLSPL